MIKQMFKSMKRILSLGSAKKDSAKRDAIPQHSEPVLGRAKFNRAKEAAYFIKKKLKNRSRRKLANESRRINRLVSA